MHIAELINRLAATQHGCVAHRQLLEAGATRRQIERANERGSLVGIFRGVYRVPGVPDSWEGDVMATVLFSGDGSAASHRAAARLHGLLRTEPIVEICTPRKRRARSLPSSTVVHTSIILPRTDLTTVGGIPCSSVERTLVDLGAVQSERRVAHALDSALRNSKTDLELLEYIHARRRGRGRRGAGVLARVLEQHGRSGATESPYERDLLMAIERVGLPLPVTQYRIESPAGNFVARADLAWPAARLIVEVDGHGFHSDRDQRAYDARRQNGLVSLGWTVIRFTTDQVHTEVERVLAEIAGFLRSCDI